MAKEKKQNYSNQSNNNKNNNRNIQKESPHNQRGNSKHQKGTNQRDGNRKKGSFGTINEYQLPPIKARSNPSNQVPQMSSLIPTSSLKKAITAKSEQVQEVIIHLSALETLLNSYEQLEMDQNSNMKSLVESILRKKVKRE